MQRGGFPADWTGPWGDAGAVGRDFCRCVARLGDPLFSTQVVAGLTRAVARSRADSCVDKRAMGRASRVVDFSLSLEEADREQRL